MIVAVRPVSLFFDPYQLGSGRELGAPFGGLLRFGPGLIEDDESLDGRLRLEERLAPGGVHRVAALEEYRLGFVETLQAGQALRYNSTLHVSLSLP